MLSTIAYLQNQGAVMSPVSKMSRNETGFYQGISKISEYLFHLGNECRRGQFDVAQNTFLDMQQHWQRLDVLINSMPDSSIQKNYWPSDSLQILEKHLNEIYLSEDQEKHPFEILKEINRISSKVEKIQELKICRRTF